MAIEFRCTVCHNLLRVADDAAGRQGRCPQCGTPFTIPAAGTAAAAGPPQPQGELKPTPIDIKDVILRTWDIFKVQWALCLSAGILAWAAMILAKMILVVGPFALGFYVVKSLTVAVVLGFLGSLATIMVWAWILVGTIRFFLGVVRGHEPPVGDIFTGGPQFVPFLITLMLFSFVSGGILLVGLAPGFMVGLVWAWLGGVVRKFVLLIAVGVVVLLLLMFSQAFFLIVDRNMQVIDALQQSNRLTDGNKVYLFVLLVLVLVLQMVAVIPFGLGLLVTMPFVSLLYAVIYLRISGQLAETGAGSRRP
jgi:MFS family permease